MPYMQTEEMPHSASEALTWETVLGVERKKPYFQNILSSIEQERASGKTIYPANRDIFAAFQSTPFEQVRVVIIGQDPYHGPGQAHGLCFSVQEGVPFPPSLQNIFKELESDVGIARPANGCLQRWAEQGVLLLNTVLSVRAGQAHSHKDLGWEQFTDAVIAEINEHRQDVIFLLWGSHAQKKGASIDARKHTILRAPHPSPLSAHRGFFGCKHFSQTNEILRDRGQVEIDWSIP